MTEHTDGDASTQSQVQTQKVANPYIIPGAVVMAGGLVAFAIFFSGGNSLAPVAGTAGTQPTQVPQQPTGSTNEIKAVDAGDHIKGSIDAPVKIVEFSDYECPFCKRFHNTMNAAMDKFIDSGEVAWVYRHFPLDQLHPRNARVVATAAECVNEFGGNDAFWTFSDGFFAVTPSNDRTDLKAVLPPLYVEAGVDQAKVEACIASGKYDQHIQDDFDDAVATGGRGTPWSVIIGSDGKTYPLNGAQPLASVEQLIGIANKNK